jgi:integrase
VCQPNGKPAHPISLSQWCRRNGVRFHSLRHGHASQLLNAGINIKSVSARSGHSSAAMTLNVYSHLMPGADEAAAAAIDKAIG